MSFEVCDSWPTTNWDDDASVTRTIEQLRPEMWPKHMENPIVLENLELVQRAGMREGTVLDFGCGGGLYRPLLPRGMAYVGVDASERMVDFCRQDAPEGKFVVCRQLPLPFADKSFDLVFASGTIHVIEDWKAALAECARLTGQKLIIARLPTLRRSPTRIVVQRYRHARGEEVHAMYALDRHELSATIKSLGLVVEHWDYTSEIFSANGLREPIVMNSLLLRPAMTGVVDSKASM